MVSGTQGNGESKIPVGGIRGARDVVGCAGVGDASLCGVVVADMVASLMRSSCRMHWAQEMFKKMSLFVELAKS